MKLTILKNKLKEGLSYIERIVTKSLTLPILNNILIKTEKNFLNLSSTNLEIGIKWWALAKVEKEGSIVVPAKIISDLLSFLKEKPLTLTTENQTLMIELDGYQTKVKGLNPEDFPIIPDVPTQEVITLNSLDFCRGLEQIVQIPILSSARPEISGIYLVFQKNLITMVATDSFRLGEKRLQLKKTSSLPKEISLILPQKTARELIAIFGEKAGELKIYFSPNQILFEREMEETSHPEIHLVSKLIEGEYPDYKAILPTKFSSLITVDRNEFLNQLRAASLFASKINEVKLKTNSKKGEIDIFSQNPDLGEYHSSIFGKVQGKDLQISFNWKFLIDGILNIKSQKVVLQLNSEEEAVVLKGADDESYLYLVMPMKAS